VQIVWTGLHSRDGRHTRIVRISTLPRLLEWARVDRKRCIPAWVDGRLWV